MVKFVAVVVAVGVLLLGGCGGGSEKPADGGQAAGRPTAAGGQPVKRKAMTAAQVLAGLRGAGVPIKTTVVYTEESDPNSMLGRPGKYTSKAACYDRRVPKAKIRDRKRGSVEWGCDVEVFPTEKQAQARSKYIQAALEGLGGMVRGEYHYIRGGVLLRVTELLTPSQAKGYERALGTLPL